VLLLSAEAFLDINLNDGLSGIELRHRLKAAGISVPVIYMTGNDNPAVRVAALQSGCVAYLTNPFSAKSRSSRSRAPPKTPIRSARETGSAGSRRWASIVRAECWPSACWSDRE